jgi:hypothetical protein
MGQILNNPPSVEGWHQGTDWLDSGTLVERINFASQQIGDTSKPGVEAMINKIGSEWSGVTSPDRLVDACLEQVGALTVEEDTRKVLVEFAAQGASVRDPEGASEAARQHIAEVLQMVAATQEFQRS